MVSFGRRNNNNNNNNNNSRATKYATTPLDIPGILYSNRKPNKQEVDADGDLGDLIKQEIARYEELFNSNSNLRAAQDDDDTLNDGSIYTSMQASAALFPPPTSISVHNNNSNMNNRSAATATSPSKEKFHIKDYQYDNDDEDEEETMWGLANPEHHQDAKAAPATSLLNSEEAAAVNACTIAKPKSGRKLHAPPVPGIVSVDHQAGCGNKLTTPAKATTVTMGPVKKTSTSTPVPTTTAPTKKNKFKPSFSAKRLLGKAGGTVSIKHAIIPSTPRTQASTPSISTGGPKMKLFSSVKFSLKSTKFSSSKQQQQHSKQQQQHNNHQNLLLASKATGSSEPLPPPSNGAGSRKTQPATGQATGRSAGHPRRRLPTPPPSPPPPIQEIRHPDGASVVSAQSSLTDALDAWFVSSSPPKIIGGNHLQQEEDVSPFKTEPYEGALTPYDNDDKAADGIGDRIQTELGSGVDVGSSGSKNNANDKDDPSPGGHLSTEDELFFHNHHGKELSPVRAPAPQSTTTKVTQEDKDMQVVKILGLEEEDKANSNVKRDLFGANIIDTNTGIGAGGDDAPLEVSQVPEEQNLVHGVVADDRDVAAAVEEELPLHHHKSSKFKKFLHKLVATPPKKQVVDQDAQKWKAQQERLKAQLLEEERLELEETKRIEQKKQQELERQRKLELGGGGGGGQSNDSDPLASRTSDTGSSSSALDVDNNSAEEDCPARLATRSFSLMSGQMKPMDQPTSQSSMTADITAFQTVQTSPSSLAPSSIQDSPMPSTYSNQDEEAVASANMVAATPKSNSSHLVNFQFRRQDDDGGRSYTMAYAVDYSSSTGDIKWKDIVNEAWKEDRKLVKSGVFSSIEANTIKRIRNADLEMRFTLPFWGKHASQTLGGKSLGVLLDVVGPQRPVQVTITLEEPVPVAAGVEDGAPDCLF